MPIVIAARGTAEKPAALISPDSASLPGNAPMDVAQVLVGPAVAGQGPRHAGRYARSGGRR